MNQPLSQLPARDDRTTADRDASSPAARTLLALRALGPGRLLVLSAAALALLAFFAYLLLRAIEPPYTLLYGSLELDDSAPIVGGACRWAGPAPATAAARFSYPCLDPATPPEHEPGPPATFSQDELASTVEAARREAHAEAEAAVLAEMVASREHRETEALAAIGAALAASQGAHAHALAARAGASRDLVLAVARALVARALALQPLADVEAMFREMVARLEGHPWLEVRLPPDLVAAGEAALTRAAAPAGYQGELRILPEAELGPGDARIAWQDGAARRDLARIEAEATALVAAWLPAEGEGTAPARAQPEDASTDGFA